LGLDLTMCLTEIHMKEMGFLYKKNTLSFLNLATYSTVLFTTPFYSFCQHS